jgi:hypothetical protein
VPQYSVGLFESAGSREQSGLALGGNGELIVGRSATGSQTVVLNPAGTGTIINLEAKTAPKWHLA